MPGSIRVLVMEAFDLPESINDGEEVAVKVAVGSIEFQTEPNKTSHGQTASWSRDFVFPVSNLRDNLLVMLVNKNGEKISQSEIDTPVIVERGSFELYLLLDGGGNIHLSLSFVLTDEERQRIDIMRAAALKRREQEATKSNFNSELPEKEIESIFQQSDEPQTNQSDQELESIQQEPSTGFELGEEMDTRGIGRLEKSRGVGPISPKDNVDGGEAIEDQMNLMPSSAIEIQSQASPSYELEKQTSSETGVKSSGETGELNHGDAIDDSVKARIKAFETSKQRGAATRGPSVSSTGNVSVSNPQSEANADTAAEQSMSPKEHHGEVDGHITEDLKSDSGNQMESMEPIKGESESNLTGPLKTEYNRNEKVGLHEGDSKRMDNNRELVPIVDNVKMQEMDTLHEKSQMKAPKPEKRQINFDGISKQVLNGAIVGVISGALLIAASAVLWGRNSNKRNRRNTHIYRQVINVEPAHSGLF